jgi:hypothetical protein
VFLHPTGGKGGPDQSPHTHGRWGRGLYSIGPASDTCDRSSVELEQILPSDKHVQDPQDFYASDSPVLVDSSFDSDQDMYRSAEEFEICNNTEVEDEHQDNTFVARFSYLAYTLVHELLIGAKHSHSQHLPQPATSPLQSLQPLSPQSSRPPAVTPALPSNHGGMSQHRAVTSSSHCVRGPLRVDFHENTSTSQDAGRDQQVSHSTVTMSLRLIRIFIVPRGVGLEAVGRNKADVDKVHGAVGLVKMRWPSVYPTYATHFYADCIWSRNWSGVNSTISSRRTHPMAARLNLLGF